MADGPLNDLNYGRPGLTSYDLDSREWAASREPTTSVLQRVSEWQLAIPTATSSIPTTSSKKATTSRKDARWLTHNHPQLTPAANDLPDLGALSQAVTSAASTYDPHTGDLLSYGTVFLKKSFRPKQIAALPTGSSGNILRLVPLTQQKTGWESDRSVWLQGTSFGLVDSGYWNEEAAPIQQVVFGQTETSNSFLAVRLLSRVVLFRPLYHRGRQAAPPSPYYDLPPSLLSAHPILSITIEQTRGAPHADVAFNPDYQFQFGIVDQQGSWSLWQIERRAKRDEYSASRLAGGSIHSAEEDVPDHGDGWARILWAGDNNTLVVCNRRQLSLINVTGETFEYLQTPSVIPEQSSDWILDIKRHPESQHRFFVLTSTRIFLISVTTSSSAGGVMSAGATILMSRRHYRGDEDLTLRMHLEISEEQTVLFVTSRLNKLVQVYYYQDKSSSRPSNTDPIQLSLELPGAASIMQMHLQPLEYAAKEMQSYKRRNTFAQSYRERGIPFHQLTVITADLGVYQNVLLSSEYDADPEQLTWRKIVLAKGSLDARNDIDGMDDFIEPNGPGWEAEPELKMKSQVPRKVSNEGMTCATVDYAHVYESLIYNEQPGSMSVEDVVQYLQESMSLETSTYEANS